MNKLDVYFPCGQKDTDLEQVFVHTSPKDMPKEMSIFDNFPQKPANANKFKFTLKHIWDSRFCTEDYYFIRFAFSNLSHNWEYANMISNDIESMGLALLTELYDKVYGGYSEYFFICATGELVSIEYEKLINDENFLKEVDEIYQKFQNFIHFVIMKLKADENFVNNLSNKYGCFAYVGEVVDENNKKLSHNDMKAILENELNKEGFSEYNNKIHIMEIKSFTELIIKLYGSIRKHDDLKPRTPKNLRYKSILGKVNIPNAKWIKKNPFDEKIKLMWDNSGENVTYTIYRQIETFVDLPFKWAINLLTNEPHRRSIDFYEKIAEDIKENEYIDNINPIVSALSVFHFKLYIIQAKNKYGIVSDFSEHLAIQGGPTNEDFEKFLKMLFKK